MNAFDQHYIDWLKRNHRVAALSDERLAEIERAFYAGAATCGRLIAERRPQVVLDAITAHLARARRAAIRSPSPLAPLLGTSIKRCQPVPGVESDVDRATGRAGEGRGEGGSRC